MGPEDSVSTRVITIGIGGATSSGKTILAKHLKNCLHNSYIFHQDDFVSSLQELPLVSGCDFVDCEAAPTAIDWDRLATSLTELKKTGSPPKEHQSFEGLNETASIDIDNEIIQGWKMRSRKLAEEQKKIYGGKLVWVLVDGFLLYWDERIVADLDLRVFLRVPEDVAKTRREERTYYTPDGSVWRDPPQYWEKAVWPAYIRAHEHMFEGEDVVKGKPNGQVKNLMLFEATETNMQDMVNTVMEGVLNLSTVTCP